MQRQGILSPVSARFDLMATAENQAKLDALKVRSGELHLAEFWSELRPGLPNLEPIPASKPHVWRFEDASLQLRKAAELVTLEEAERRAVVFKNPGLGGRIATTPTMFAAYSLYNPGERASVHRHTINAGRIGLTGTGGYTTVDRVKCILNRGDLVLTPNWSWHDHGNDGDEPTIWFDFLDQPLTMALGSRFFDLNYVDPVAPESNNKVQSPRATISAGRNPYAVGGVFPNGRLTDLLSKEHTIFYEYARSRDMLVSLRNNIDPYDGICVRLKNGHTGGSVLDTVDISLAMLPGSFATQPVRQSCSSIYLVVEGAGSTTVGDQQLEWGENDVFVVSNWSWFQHNNDDPERDAVLYALTDEPLLRKVGGWRRQGRDTDDLITQLG